MVKQLNLDAFKYKFSDDWWERLKDFWATEDGFKIYRFLRERSSRGKFILPESDLTFRAFSECSFNDTRVIIVGMEPYSSVINKVPVADGLAFSCSQTNKLQPSLEYLWYAIKNTVDPDVEFTPDLKWVANQGVLLLNYSLTAENQSIGAHLKVESFGKGCLWDSFYKYLFQEAMYSTTGIIYILMGVDAKKVKKYINPLGNYILETAHPSFAARNKDDDWAADNVFKTANQLLMANNGSQIEWNKSKLNNEDLDSLPF